MKFAEFDSPRSHLVIDDLFSPEDLADLWSEVLQLEPLMRIGLPGGEENRYNDIKNNRNTVISPAVRLGGRKNRSTGIVKRTLWRPDLSDALERCGEPSFRLLKFCGPGDLHFSSYADGQFYGAHPDVNDPVNLTVVVFLCRTPKKFSGGNFRLFFNGRTKVVQFKNNRAVIFPSNTVHDVTPVRLDSRKFEDCRVTLQLWPKLENGAVAAPPGAAKRKSSGRSKAIDAYLLPRFGVDEQLWREVVDFFQYVKLPAGWHGSLDRLVRNPSAAISVLASNLKYLGREFFPDKTVGFESEAFGGGRAELARIAGRFSDGGLTRWFGYAIARSSGRTALRLFVRMAATGKPPLERSTDIATDADYAHTRAALRGLLRDLPSGFADSGARSGSARRRPRASPRRSIA